MTQGRNKCRNLFVLVPLSCCPSISFILVFLFMCWHEWWRVCFSCFWPDCCWCLFLSVQPVVNVLWWCKHKPPHTIIAHSQQPAETTTSLLSTNVIFKEERTEHGWVQWLYKGHNKHWSSCVYNNTSTRLHVFHALGHLLWGQVPMATNQWRDEGDDSDLKSLCGERNRPPSDEGEEEARSWLEMVLQRVFGRFNEFLSYQMMNRLYVDLGLSFKSF